MQITLNNRKEELPEDNLSVQKIIELKNFTFPMLVTKINGKVVKKTHRATTFVKEGDDVLIIHLVSGG